MQSPRFKQSVMPAHAGSEQRGACDPIQAESRVCGDKSLVHAIARKVLDSRVRGNDDRCSATVCMAVVLLESRVRGNDALLA
jgi:hypothetical protein